MELKEIEKQIQLITGCSSLESGTIMIFIQQHGNKQYNKALSDMKKEFICKCDAGGCDMDEQSFDNLKKH